jgi:hypothetical protein
MRRDLVIAAARKSGASISIIADAMDLSTSRVWDILREMEERKSGSPWNPDPLHMPGERVHRTSKK